MASPSQEFTAKTLGWMRRWKSQGHLRPASGAYPHTDTEWAGLLEDISEKVRSGTFIFEHLYSTRIKGKVTVTTKSLEECLVLRKLNDNVRRSYGLKHQNRQSIVRTAKQAFYENTPKSVIRLDIKKCFESIDRQKVLAQLSSDGRLAFQSIALLDKFFEACSKLTPQVTRHGLPRGIVISTTLAEIQLQMIDRLIRRLPGVYLVLRYVDDILVFTTEPPAFAKPAIVSAIESLKLQINGEKTQMARIECECERQCNHSGTCPCASRCKCQKTRPSNVKSIEYLGYKFYFSAYNAEDSLNEVHCMLSDRKVIKIKSRIHSAFSSFKATGDSDLLLQRMQYLSGNQAVAVSPSRRSLLNGLAFTHPEYAPPREKQTHSTSSIAEFDRFYRCLLRMHARIADAAALPLLERISFSSGFTHKRRTKFSPAEVLRIKECWSNE